MTNMLEKKFTNKVEFQQISKDKKFVCRPEIL